MKLTIGMASHNNYAEVWFTIQALRMYQDLNDVEILVVDNFGDDRLQTFIRSWTHGTARYIRFTERTGTAAPRDLVFKKAAGEWVLCIDSHVLLVSGAVQKFKEWIASNRDCADLLHGPLLYDDLKHAADAMNDEWRSQMWGTWRGMSVQPLAHGPYEIPMHGLGLFGCRKESWLGFNPNFSGFGGEEGYIHAKYRKAGRRVLLLPFLRWVHKFAQGQVPYVVKLDDRIRNYCIGFEELGMDPAPVISHFGEAAIRGVYPQILKDVPVTE